ncbi:MAG: DUF2007 domain-containing protein [Clostridia bacterium]|nr:DUF2007 domain-containing protein [Clostridia bacterium]
MKICHVCGVECEDNAELCAVCGADLTQIEQAEEDANVIKSPALLATFEDVVSAEIFKDILTDNGILYSCDGDIDDGAMQVTFGGSFVSENIYVNEEDFEKADNLYKEFIENEPEFDGEFVFDEEFEEE